MSDRPRPSLERCTISHRITPLYLMLTVSSIPLPWQKSDESRLLAPRIRQLESEVKQLRAQVRLLAILFSALAIVPRLGPAPVRFLCHLLCLVFAAEGALELVAAL